MESEKPSAVLQTGPLRAKKSCIDLYPYVNRNNRFALI